jgi:hypothetical protein
VPIRVARSDQRAVVLARRSVRVGVARNTDGRARGVSSARRCSRESPALDRHFRDTVAVSALRVPDFGGVHGGLDCCRSCASARARWEWLGGGSLLQFAVAAAVSGLMWANMLRPFQVGKARTSHEGPWSWIRESRVASAQGSWPACHFTNASASAVM